jgi:hypothetical protein
MLTGCVCMRAWYMPNHHWATCRPSTRESLASEGPCTHPLHESPLNPWSLFPLSIVPLLDPGDQSRSHGLRWPRLDWSACQHHGRYGAFARSRWATCAVNHRICRRTAAKYGHFITSRPRPGFNSATPCRSFFSITRFVTPEESGADQHQPASHQPLRMVEGWTGSGLRCLCHWWSTKVRCWEEMEGRPIQVVLT